MADTAEKFSSGPDLWKMFIWPVLGVLFGFVEVVSLIPSLLLFFHKLRVKEIKQEAQDAILHGMIQPTPPKRKNFKLNAYEIESGVHWLAELILDWITRFDWNIKFWDCQEE